MYGDDGGQGMPVGTAGGCQDGEALGPINLPREDDGAAAPLALALAGGGGGVSSSFVAPASSGEAFQIAMDSFRSIVLHFPNTELPGS